MVTACNPNADALTVVQDQNAKLKATVDTYQTFVPTMTAQASAVAQKLAEAQAQVATLRAQNAALISKTNGSQIQGGAAAPAGQPASSSSMDSTGGNTVTGNNPPPAAPPSNQDPQQGAATVAPSSGDSAFAITSVVTSKGKDADGCATNPATVFNDTDTNIWVIAEVENYKSNTKFTATWSGNEFKHENSWAIPSGGSKICIHFYIEPKTLNLKAGNYTVTMSAPNASPISAEFTVQSQSAASNQADQSGAATQPPTK